MMIKETETKTNPRMKLDKNWHYNDDYYSPFSEEKEVPVENVRVGPTLERTILSYCEQQFTILFINRGKRTLLVGGKGSNSLSDITSDNIIDGKKLPFSSHVEIFRSLATKIFGKNFPLNNYLTQLSSSIIASSHTFWAYDDVTAIYVCVVNCNCDDDYFISSCSNIFTGDYTLYDIERLESISGGDVPQDMFELLKWAHASGGVYNTIFSKHDSYLIVDRKKKNGYNSIYLNKCIRPDHSFVRCFENGIPGAYFEPDCFGLLVFPGIPYPENMPTLASVLKKLTPFENNFQNHLFCLYVLGCANNLHNMLKLTYSKDATEFHFLKNLGLYSMLNVQGDRNLRFCHLSDGVDFSAFDVDCFNTLAFLSSTRGASRDSETKQISCHRILFAHMLIRTCETILYLSPYFGRFASTKNWSSGEISYYLSVKRFLNVDSRWAAWRYTDGEFHMKSYSIMGWEWWIEDDVGTIETVLSLAGEDYNLKDFTPILAIFFNDLWASLVYNKLYGALICPARRWTTAKKCPSSKVLAISKNGSFEDITYGNLRKIRTNYKRTAHRVELNGSQVPRNLFPKTLPCESGSVSVSLLTDFELR